MKNTEVLFNAGGAFVAGICGGFMGVAIASWLADRPKLLGAEWWEVFTAFGTVGAVLAALLVPIVGYAARKKAQHIASIDYVGDMAANASRFNVRLALLRDMINHEAAHGFYLTEKEVAELRNVLNAILAIDTLKLAVSAPSAAKSIQKASMFLDDAIYLLTSERNTSAATVDRLIERAQEELVRVFFSDFDLSIT